MPLNFGHCRVLSTRYDSQDIGALEMLGVVRLSEKVFIAAIRQLANDGWHRFDQHDDLARILLKVNNGSLMDIALIPVDTHPGVSWKRH